MRWCLQLRGRLSRCRSATTQPRGDREIRVKVSSCGVCRTDLHVVDAELPGIKYPIVPGHEIVGRVDLIGSNPDLAPCPLL